MDYGTWVILIAVGALGSNYLLKLGSNWHRRRFFFWLVQAVNLTGACFMAGWGVPEFREGSLKVMNFVLSALFIVHVLQNNQRLQRAVAEDRSSDPLEERAAAVLERMKGSE